jgi:hypothetical protein
MLAYLHDPFASLMFWLVLVSVLVLGAVAVPLLYLYAKRRMEREATREKEEVDS